MAIDFPSSPTVGQVYTFLGVTYTFTAQGVWATASGADLSGYVRADVAQSLTSTQQTQARSNIYAAPFDAQAYSGLQINGSMEVSQELGIGVGVTNTGYGLDGWRIDKAGTGSFSLAALASAVVPGFQNWLVVQITVVQASLGAGDVYHTSQTIEGFRVARLGWGTASAQPITIGFWTNHHLTGLYSGAVKNGAADRSYIFAYTQNAADVPQYNTVTIPGDTTGTWLTNNGRALQLVFVVAAPVSGGTFSTTSGVWTAGNFVSAPGQVNCLAATANIFRITGVVVLPGIEAPSAARSPLIMRPFDQELLLARRHYYKSGDINDMYASFGNASWLLGSFKFTVPMRAVPSIIIRDGTTPSQVSTFGGGPAAVSFVLSPSQDGFGAISGTAFIGPAAFNLIADARL